MSGVWNLDTIYTRNLSFPKWVDVADSDKLSNYVIEAVKGVEYITYVEADAAYFIKTEDNCTLNLYKNFDDVQNPTSGRVRIQFKKIEDFPTDNSTSIYLHNYDRTSHYHFYICGSGYTPYIRKVIDDVIVDQQTYAYRFNDENSFHTFDMYYCNKSMYLYVDGALVASLLTSNMNEIDISELQISFGQIDGYLKELSILKY